MDNNTGGSSFGIIAAVIIIVTVAVYFYTRSAPKPANSGLQPIGPANLPNTITNCEHYGTRVAPRRLLPCG